MKKFSTILLSVLTILSLSFTGYCEDRYEYICQGADGSSFFLDRTSITRTGSPNIFRCWYKNMVSNSVRQRYINSRRDSNIRKKLLQLSYVMYCFEINLTQNIYKGIKEYTYYTYDVSGNFIDSGVNTKGVWENIPPNSVMEGMSKAIKLIVLNDTSQRMPRVGEYNSPQHNPAKNEVSNTTTTSNYDTSSIVFIALVAGITISVLIVCAYSRLTSQKHVEATAYANTETTASAYTEAKREDTTNSVIDDFDYPYEDIERVTGL